MSLYLTTSGRRVSVDFPPELAAWPELAKVVENARRLERELQEAGTAHLAAQAALDVAIAEDHARLAEAKLKGQKKLPDGKDLGLARAALDEAERQRSAAEEARSRGAEIVVETLQQHREDYVPEADKAVASARVDEAAALTAYLEAVERCTRARETRAWLNGFPEKRGYRPTTPRVFHVGRLEPIPFDDLVHGLKVRCGLADPPPRTLAEQVRAAGQTEATVQTQVS